MRSGAGPPALHIQILPRTIFHFLAEFSTPFATGLLAKHFSTSQLVSFCTSWLRSSWAIFLSAANALTALPIAIMNIYIYEPDTFGYYLTTSLS